MGKQTINRSIFIWVNSSGSRNFVEGAKKREIETATFVGHLFNDYFLRTRLPLDPLLVKLPQKKKNNFLRKVRA